jgi:hypothetical protein
MAGAAFKSLVLVGGIGLASIGGAANARTIAVSGPADPKWTTLERGAPKALSEAQPGDVIVLGTGDYPALSPGYAAGKAGRGVTIKAARRARVTIAGIHFSAGGWHVAAGEGAITVKGPIEVSNSDDVSFEGLEVVGAPTGDLTALKGAGVAYRDVTNLRLVRCNIHHWETAFAGLNAKGLVVTDNTFSDTSSDLVHLGGNLSNAQIGRNLLTRVHSKDLLHQDAIQIFSAFATEPMDSISIFDNRIIRGAGGAAVQGIFMNGSPSTPYTNLKITGNLVMTGNYWGIGTEDARNFVISGNYVGGFTDARNGGDTMVPWIKVSDSTDGVIDANIATSTPWVDNSARVKVTNSRKIELSKPDDLAAAEAWWAARASAAQTAAVQSGAERPPG